MEQNNGYPVTIHLGARNLKNLNSVYLSDPVCKVYLKNDTIGSTEVQKKNLSPDWKETIEINYVFNEHQKLRFEIYDANSGIVGQLTQLAIGGEKKSLIGMCSSTLAALVGAPKSLSKLEIRFEHEVTGYLIVFINVGRAQRKKERKIKQIQQIQQIKQQVVVQQEEPEKVEYVKEDTKIIWKWGGLKLLDLDFFSKSDPFAMFYKFIEGNAKILIHQTPVRKNDLNPIWEIWETTEEDLCQFSKQIFVEVWDYDKVGGHDLIGNVTINYDEIKYGQKDFQLLTLKGKKAGTLKLLELTIIDPPPPLQPQIQPEPQQTQEIIQQEVEYEQEVDPEPEPPREPTFLDYLVGGWQLSMQIGIDFTFSNQPISKPDSLHFITPGQLNYYQKAIKYIGGTVIAFDHDKYVPVYGFGGTPKLPTYKKKTMDDCFPLNGNKDDPYCEDIPGILRAYEEAVPLIEFSGPTFVANILREGLKVATDNAQNGIYTVCLILTDGQIEDLDDTIKIIVDCSKLPMSIIFIGVGDENFKYMKQLDDTNFLKKQSKSQVDIRDIVQFVSYQEFKNDISLMSAKVLENLPKQFMDYMHLHNILPMKSQSVFKMSQAYK